MVRVQEASIAEERKRNLTVVARRRARGRASRRVAHPRTRGRCPRARSSFTSTGRPGPRLASTRVTASASTASCTTPLTSRASSMRLRHPAPPTSWPAPSRGGAWTRRFTSRASLPSRPGRPPAIAFCWRAIPPAPIRTSSARPAAASRAPSTLRRCFGCRGSPRRSTGSRSRIISRTGGFRCTRRTSPTSRASRPGTWSSGSTGAGPSADTGIRRTLQVTSTGSETTRSISFTSTSTRRSIGVCGRAALASS